MGTWDDGIYYPDEADGESMRLALRRAQHQVTGKCWRVARHGKLPSGYAEPYFCQNEGEFWVCMWGSPEYENYALPEYELVCGEHRASDEEEAREVGVPVPDFVPR